MTLHHAIVLLVFVQVLQYIVTFFNTLSLRVTLKVIFKFPLHQRRSVAFKMCKNAFVAVDLPRTPLGELTTLPDTPVGWGGGYPLPILYPFAPDF